MVFSQRNFHTLKVFLRAILFIKKVLGIRRIQNSRLPNQPNTNTEECFAWTRITLDDIDMLWRKSGKLHAPFGCQLTHIAQGVESILHGNAPQESRLYWRNITQADIDRQWSASSTAHPAFGRQLCHFAVGIERISKDRNKKNR